MNRRYRRWRAQCWEKRCPSVDPSVRAGSELSAPGLRLERPRKSEPLDEVDEVVERDAEKREQHDRAEGERGAELLGGDGDDNLIGGSGRSILIGGRGKDRLVGGSGDDILIGGSTAYDEDTLVLCAVSEEWNSTDSYDARVTELRLLLDATSVIDDGDVDMLSGSNGRDWFFEGLGDVVTRIQDDEDIG